MRQTNGKLLPAVRMSDLGGKLIVIEGTDGAGRTTQINLLRPWLEELGHAVSAGKSVCRAQPSRALRPCVLFRA
jgi:ABC-type hemin transport system ATPase subunit